jgi:hypothetical protein
MRLKIFILAFGLFNSEIVHCQFIDRYGINVGLTFATQKWDYKYSSVNSVPAYSPGITIFTQAEKDFGKTICLRAELGYMQKGFKNTQNFIFSNGEHAKIIHNTSINHNTTLNLGIKIRPLRSDIAPYFIIGPRFDYTTYVRAIEIEEPGSNLRFKLNTNEINESNKFNVGVLFGLGLKIKEQIYFEIEYNPNLTNTFKASYLSIRDNAWGVRLGLNINNISN